MFRHTGLCVSRKSLNHSPSLAHRKVIIDNRARFHKTGEERKKGETLVCVSHISNFSIFGIMFQ